VLPASISLNLRSSNADCCDTGQSWQAAFAFEIVGVVFYIWMMVVASQVNKDEYE